MNRVGLAGLAVALVLSSSTSSTALAVTPIETPCSPRSDVDDRDVVITWGGEVVRPIRWGRPLLRVDVVLTSKSTRERLCDPDAWIEIRRVGPTRRLIDAGPVTIVDDVNGHTVHRFEWAIQDRVGALDAGTYEIDFFTGRVPVIGIGADDRFTAGFVPTASRHTVVKWPTPHKGRVQVIERS
jgi:hypothetical protein